MFSKPQIHHKSTPTPNFTIISNSFNIKKHAQPNSTFRIPQKPSKIHPQTEFRYNSKFIQHKKTRPTSQHPQNPPKTRKFN